ncbi:MAG: hypothetical protein MH321_11070 [Leptospiraceae bacterium]|nr:hypothetical protein [Leptospiraceae bacterium]
MKLFLLSILVLINVGCSHDKKLVPVVQTAELPLAEPGYRLTGQTSAKACRPNFFNSEFLFFYSPTKKGILKENSIFAEKSPVEYEILANENPELLALNEKIRKEKSIATTYYNPVVWVNDFFVGFFNGLNFIAGQEQVSYLGTHRPISPEEAETVSVEFPQNKNQGKDNLSKSPYPSLSNPFKGIVNLEIRQVAQYAYYDALSKIDADYLIDGSVEVESKIRIPGYFPANDYCVTVHGTGVVLTGPLSRK